MKRKRYECPYCKAINERPADIYSMACYGCGKTSHGYKHEPFRVLPDEDPDKYPGAWKQGIEKHSLKGLSNDSDFWAMPSEKEAAEAITGSRLLQHYLESYDNHGGVCMHDETIEIIKAHKEMMREVDP